MSVALSEFRSPWPPTRIPGLTWSPRSQIFKTGGARHSSVFYHCSSPDLAFSGSRLPGALHPRRSELLGLVVGLLQTRSLAHDDNGAQNIGVGLVQVFTTSLGTTRGIRTARSALVQCLPGRPLHRSPRRRRLGRPGRVERLVPAVPLVEDGDPHTNHARSSDAPPSRSPHSRCSRKKASRSRSTRVITTLA